MANVDMRMDVVQTWRLPEKLARELEPPPDVVKNIARQVRFGKGGVAEQFRRQGQITRAGFKKWKPSKRARRTGGRTLIDTGAYFRAWLGRGPGSVSKVERTKAGSAIVVGIDRVLFPRVFVFQKDRPTTFRRGGSSWKVAQRPVRMNNAVVKDTRSIYVGHVKKQVEALGG